VESCGLLSLIAVVAGMPTGVYPWMRTAHASRFFFGGVVGREDMSALRMFSVPEIGGLIPKVHCVEVVGIAADKRPKSPPRMDSTSIPRQPPWTRLATTQLTKRSADNHRFNVSREHLSARVETRDFGPRTDAQNRRLAILPIPVIPGYTLPVKTAISVPDSTFDRVEQKAHELGWSRSEFYSTAAERLIEQIDKDDLATTIDSALDIIGSDDDSGDAAVAAGRQTVAGQDW